MTKVKLIDAKGRKITMSKYAWELSKHSKNGYRIDDGKQPKKQGNVPPEVAHGSYDILMNNYKGFIKDGDHESALKKLEAAQKINDSLYIKGLITKAKKEIKNPTTTEAPILTSDEISVNEMTEAADELYDEKDYTAAHEIYTTAHDLIPSTVLEEKVAACIKMINKKNYVDPNKEPVKKDKKVAKK